MTKMHDALIESGTRALTSVINRKITSLVERKFAERGVTLTKSQRARLRKHVRDGEGDGISFRQVHGQPDLTEAIQIEPEDLQEIESWLDNRQHVLDKVVLDVLRRMVPGYVAELRARWPARRVAEARHLRRFERLLRDRWDEPLSLLELLIVVCREAGEEAITTVIPNGPNATQALYSVLTRLHARACQVASEVSVLLAHGYPDGAMARWRTLHEISVVAIFIAEAGETAAERYIEHLDVESWKAAEGYITFQARAGLRPFSTREHAKLKKRRDQLKAKYGAPFVDSDWGWAHGFLKSKNPKPTFAAIEETVQRDHMRPYFKLACQAVHASAKGAFYKMGLPPGENVLVAGASTFGLADPGQNTAISLTLTTMAMMHLGTPTLDVLLYLKTASRFMNLTVEAFVRVYRAQAKEIRSKKKDRP